MKVLLAEDSRSNQMLIQAYVEEAGHQVVTADNGQEAVNEFEANRPDLVLLDVTMPVMDGIAAAKQIREITDRDHDWVPIVFLSAMTNSDDIARGIDAGGDDYLTKPVDATVLNAKLRAMQRIAEMRQQLHKANLELKMMTVKDGLTGIANRRHFDDVVKRELKRAVRTHTKVSLILCDIDKFKPYNDNYGHQKGDDCLKSVAQIMQSAVKRPGDVLARYGGEEFAVVLPETGSDGGEQLAEAIRLAVEQHGLPHEFSEGAPYVTLSLGVSTVLPTDADNIMALIRTLIENADKALYQAKQGGRNQVQVFEG